jgi:hypothetical protein
MARAQGVLRVEPDEMLPPVFYFSPEVDEGWVLDVLPKAAADNLRFILPASMSAPSLPAIQRLAHWLGVRPPLWRHTQTVRRVLRLFGQDMRTPDRARPKATAARRSRQAAERKRPACQPADGRAAIIRCRASSGPPR